MTISDYFKNYSTLKYSKKLSNGYAYSIEDLYKDCIKDTLPDVNDVLAWHKMLMQYTEMPDAIYWIRYYENGPLLNSNGQILTVKNDGSYRIRDNSGKTVLLGKAGELATKKAINNFVISNGFRYNNRRACLTQFADDFSYVFVSNYDVHEIFNMISHHVVPTANEFLTMMKSFKFHLHYDTSKSCMESDIAAFPNIGNVRGGVLTQNKWYLAHINSIKNDDCPYVRNNGNVSKLSSTEKNKLYPIGEPADWSVSSNGKIRRLNYSLTSDEKELVKAHFLRFTDPLNYFLAPGKNYETNNTSRTIGENKYLTSYMEALYETIYGTSVMDEFREKAKIRKNPFIATGKEIVEVHYGIHKKNNCSTAQHPSQAVRSNPNQQASSTEKVGQYAKNTFTNLLNSGKLSPIHISNLTDKVYCRANFGISYPVLVLSNSGNYDPKRYYKDVIAGKYVICSQWYEQHRTKIEDWITKEKF